MNSIQIGDLFIPVPIVQGGMGVGISLSGLASAVANKGGVGVISTVGIGLIGNKPYKSFKQANIEALQFEIRKAKTLTKGILGANIMGVLTNFSDLVQTSIEEGIDIIFSGAGLPLDLPKYLTKGAKTKLVPIVSSARAATILCDKWKQNYDYLPDALVVEGPKAGGHLGFKLNEIGDENFSLEKIVAEVYKVTLRIKELYNKKIPIIAAGGISTGEDIYNIMQLGADAVQIGSKFVATYECDASPEFKDAFIKAKEQDIRIIVSPVGMPGRAISNEFLNQVYGGETKPIRCKHHCIKTCNPKTTMYCIADALIQAHSGNLGSGFAFAGANAYKIDKISSVEEVMDTFEKEYDEAVAKHSK